MSFSAPQLCHGMPSVWCATHPTCLDLERLADALLKSCQHLIWLDSARPHAPTARFSVLGWDPWLTITSSGDETTVQTSSSTDRHRGDPLEVLREVLICYPGLQGRSIPPMGLGLLGVLSYELNRWIERLPDPKGLAVPVPPLWLFGMRLTIVVDHETNTSWCVSVIDPHQLPSRAATEARDRLEALHDLSRSLGSASALGEPSGRVADLRVESHGSQSEFEAMVHAAKAHILDGDIFQANLSHQFTGEWFGPPWPLYRTLRQVNPSPFACFLTAPEATLVSCSPERLVSARDGVATTRPIAGTRPRGANPEEDLAHGLELILSDKERAEHVMLVDLARNDLGRVCRFGSVRVEDLMALEEYSHVMHLVSNVSGALRDDVDAVDVIRAMFPGGTITGCPKVRSMEIIHALEPSGRGPYTGSCGYLGFDGSLDLNILIRTLVIGQGTVSFHVGAGIVADSEPDREYHETLAKAGALLQALRTASRLPSGSASSARSPVVNR